MATSEGAKVLSLTELASRIHPDRTVLLLGAGAAVSSGAPTGTQLASRLSRQLNPSPPTEDLSQVCGIWEFRSDRRSLVAEIRSYLAPLKPSNALLTLPNFPWRNIYSTNFDQLIERSYREANRELDVIRSNYEFTSPRPGVVRLYKIHGCITKDTSFGDQARMVLTERDYDLVQDYREAIFRALAFDLITADTLIIGQSLTDAHLRNLAKEAAKLRSTSGTPGQVYLVAYERDEDQASLLEQFGLQVSFGSLEDLFFELVNAGPDRTAASSASPIGGLLPQRLAPACLDVAHARNLSSNPLRLFNGASATFGDIAAGLTVTRAVERRFMDAQDSRKGFFTVITGAAGVGKTSMARRILIDREAAGFSCWEALDSYPIDVDGWLEVDVNLRRNHRQGFLFIDNATRSLGEVNKLVDGLTSIERPHLRLMLTANAGAWKSRYKARGFFSRGTQMALGRLTDADLNAMVNLVHTEPRIAELVDPAFRSLNRAQQLARLRDRCNSEMFVCLKNIFGSAELDYILLEEYASLGEPEKDIYRHVSALQAMGARVHRQLILRCLSIEAGMLEAILTLLDGIVDEDVVNERDGLYRWNVRHDVIAEVIAKYKFADPEQLLVLLNNVIEGINPSVAMEIETARAICTTEWGLQRLPDANDQIRLLKRLIEILPSERIPRRRLIKRYLDSRDLGEASHEIRAARIALRSGDVIVDRYEVLGLLYRAQDDTRLMEEDRLAILYDALGKGKRLASTGRADKQNIRVFAEVALALAKSTGDVTQLRSAISLFSWAEEELLDPDISKVSANYERLASYLDQSQRGPIDLISEVPDEDAPEELLEE